MVADLRNGLIPILLPGTEEKIVRQFIPIETRNLRLPNIRIVDRCCRGRQRRTRNAKLSGLLTFEMTVDVSLSETGGVHEHDADNTILVLPQ